jgi:Na+-translocating ferredoxin:NAD+ oxidoreductase subunit G
MIKKGKQIIATGIALALFAMVGTSMVAITHTLSIKKIKENQLQARLMKFYQVFDKNKVNNDFLTDYIVINSKLLNPKKNTNIFRLRFNDIPYGIVLESSTFDGYSGEIKLLIGINFNGTVTGVRVVSHKETPGLGDKIEIRKDSWITSFNNKKLQPHKMWNVTKDGGIFKAFTGATITPRAVVKAVKNALIFYQQNKSTLY